MSGDAYEITTDDLILETPEPTKQPSRPLPTPRSRSGVSVTAVPTGDITPPVVAPVAARPRIDLAALSRPIKERTRVRTADKVDEGATSLSAKAAAFFERAIEAERAGDAAAAIRHVKLAITFDPREPRYHALLGKLAR